MVTKSTLKKKEAQPWNLKGHNASRLLQKQLTECLSSMSCLPYWGSLMTNLLCIRKITMFWKHFWTKWLTYRKIYRAADVRESPAMAADISVLWAQCQILQAYMLHHDVEMLIYKTGVWWDCANTIVDLMMDWSNVSETTNFTLILAEGNMNAYIKLRYIILGPWRSGPNFVAIHPIVVFWLCNYKTRVVPHPYKPSCLIFLSCQLQGGQQASGVGLH